MSLRSSFLLAAILLLSLPALAANTDALTGEPIPALMGDTSQVAPIAPQERDGDLILLAHLADGTSKSVRALPNNVVIWQNGAWLIAHDISVPTAPVEISRYLLAAQPSDIQVIDNTVYLALRKTAGLLILDYTDPANPVTIGNLPDFDLLSVAVQGDRAYCGRGSAGVLVIDLTDPAAPFDINLFDTFHGSQNFSGVQGAVIDADVVKGTVEQIGRVASAQHHLCIGFGSE